MHAISIENLKKTFGDVTAVDIPEYTAEEGGLIGLVGNNGAGKTTFLRLLLDLTKPDTGSIDLEGCDPSKSEKWKDTTGAFLDDGFLLDFLTPEEYFGFIAKVDGISEGSMDERLSAVEKFMNGGILGQGKYIRSLSAGNKQKVGIIAAMLNQPRILILDEPFNFLDPSSQLSLKELLRDYNISTGATVIISSHNLQHVVDVCNRVVVMEKGHFVMNLDNEGGKAEGQLKEYFALH